jgi:hypothetical protein
MENERLSLASLTNEQVLERVKALAAGERVATAALIASLAELDARGLYLGEGFPSLFAYCTQALHLSEGGAYNRTQVARAARKWPVIIQMVADGSVTLTAVRLLGGRLTDANHRQLLDAITHKTKREVEEIVAALDPKPPVPSLIRRLPTTTPEVLTPAAARTLLSVPDPPIGATAAEPTPTSGRPPLSRPPVVAPLAPDRYKVQFTVSRQTHDKLRRVQDLLRHQVPGGDPAMIFDRARTLLLQDLERKRLAHADKPRPAHAATRFRLRSRGCQTRGLGAGCRAVRFPRDWTKMHGAQLP